VNNTVVLGLQIQSEKDPLVVLPLIASFSKKYSEELTGIEPRNIGGNERVPFLSAIFSLSGSVETDPMNTSRASPFFPRQMALFLRHRKFPSQPC